MLTSNTAGNPSSLDNQIFIHCDALNTREYDHNIALT